MMMCGEMIEGSKCSKCEKDLSGQWGVEFLGEDYCEECFEGE